MGKNEKKRKNRSNSSKTGLTPPTKISNNMAAQNQNNTLSQVLSQAHESLHGSFTENIIPNNGQQNNQTFTCSPSNMQNLPQPVPRPVLQSTPLPVSTCNAPYGPIQQPPNMTFHQPPPDFSQPPNVSNASNVTPQMIFANLMDTTQRLQRLEVIMNERLSKLDLLDVVTQKLESFETNMSNVNQEIENIKTIQQKQSQILNNEEQHHHNIEDRVRNLEKNNLDLEAENLDLKEKFLELQTRSMKYNLIFGGIKYTDGENTEEVLRNFLTHELQIGNVDGMVFQNVHRLGERQDRRERNIIARFVKYTDHEFVRNTAAEKLKNKTNFSVYQQYPREINDRRKLLIPKLHEFRRQRRNVKLVLDKLYVDGELYVPHPEVGPNPRNGQGQS